MKARAPVTIAATNNTQAAMIGILGTVCSQFVTQDFLEIRLRCFTSGRQFFRYRSVHGDRTVGASETTE